MSGIDNYGLLINKLDQFIRKFYINKLIKGGLYFLGLVLILFLSFNLLEHQFYFSTVGRKILFFSFIGISLCSFIYWIAIPLSKYLKLGQTISHEEAATIIGKHFGDVKDKLLNILQLKRQSEGHENELLINASISQKTESIKLVPFKSAIDLRKNRKYAKYALFPLGFLVIMLFAAPSLITDSTHRIINNNQEFEKDAPFQFEFDESALEVVQYEDFPLVLTIVGDMLPAEVFIEVDNYQYRMTKSENDKFAYVFKNVQKDTEFKIYSGIVRSDEYTLNVLEKPNLLDFEINLDYPGYTGRKDETVSNIGNLIIPIGTRARWSFNTINTENLEFSFNGETQNEADRNTENSFNYSKRLMSDALYKIFISNERLPLADSIAYAINIIPDNHPTINVEQFQDSIEKSMIYFVGTASDDYGLSSLSFNYRIKDAKGVESELFSEKLEKESGSEIQYSHVFDIEDVKLKPGESISYYFEVFDNDAVNGKKAARTGLMTYSKATIEELKKQEEDNNEEIKKDLQEAIEESKNIREELKKMREKLFQEKEVKWQDKKELEKLMERQKELQEKMEKAQEKFKENLENQKEMDQPEEQIQEKQEKLEELFEEAQNEEMQKLMEQIQELMEELDKEQTMEMMEQMEQNEESSEKEMDRLLELFKQLEVEKEMKETIEKLNELAEKQEELSEKTEESEEQKDSKSEEQQKADQESLEKEQEEINKEFDELQEKVDEMEKKNEELEFPKDLGDDNKEQMESIEEDLEDSSENLEKQENQKASESQKQASEKMKQMAAEMEQQMQAGQQQQMQEDMKALRQLLENLVTLSFDQEDLVDAFGETQLNTPRYVSLVQDQFKLKDDFRLIEDSLFALSKRVTQIESFVTEKAAEVKVNLAESTDRLEDRQMKEASNNQRQVMKNVNDLALMLNESMQQMQQQMSSMMPGTQMCSKPGGKSSGQSGKVPMDKITQGQEELNGEMKGMREQMKKGEKPGSKEFAKAAAKQAALRNALREMQKTEQENGKGASEDLQKIIDQMDKIETDLVNKRLNNQMLKRQQDILTRLLEAEEAEREREYDNKRKADVAKETKKQLPPNIEEYLKKREAEIEMYNSVSPALRPYYRQLVEQYYESLKNGK